MRKQQSGGFAAPCRLKFNLLGCYFFSAALFLGAVLVSGCSSHSVQGRSQVVAKVNGDEVTVYEVNQYVQLQPLLAGTPEQIRRKAIDAVIDQHLLLSAARQAGIDRTPEVMQALLLDRKDTLIKAYLAQQSVDMPVHSPDQIKAYYLAHPALFGQRVLYRVGELHIQADSALQHKLITQLRDSKTITDFIAELDQAAIPYDEWQTVKAPESMSEYEFSMIPKMPIGSALIVEQTATQLDLLTLQGVIPEPIALERAKLRIADLLAEQEAKLKANNLVKTLRASAKIEYLN